MPNPAALDQLDPKRFHTPEILRKLTSASRLLAEFKGIAASMPNQGILLNTLGLQEAKDSSEIESIVTTQDDLFRHEVMPDAASPAAKEVLRYRQALRFGFDKVRAQNLLTLNGIIGIQAELEKNNAGFRKLPGTELKDGAGRTVYSPPQDPHDIVRLMRDLERFINDADLFDADPLVKMALIHHQFESIHPFYDGNGRTGRIINVLYLVKEGLLDTPVLYLSNHIVHTKAVYYQLLQAVREEGQWEAWVLYMLDAVEKTAADAMGTVKAVASALQDYERRIGAGYKFHSRALMDNLFMHPYTKIEFLQRDLSVSRLTATRYLEELSTGGFLAKHRAGRGNYYVNVALTAALAEPIHVG